MSDGAQRGRQGLRGWQRGSEMPTAETSGQYLPKDNVLTPSGPAKVTPVRGVCRDMAHSQPKNPGMIPVPSMAREWAHMSQAVQHGTVYGSETERQLVTFTDAPWNTK